MMALADYRLCDICGRKAFYDANLNYQFDEEEWTRKKITTEDSVKQAGEVVEGLKLDNLGDWAVICRDCAKTHKCVIVSLDAARKGE
jgi:hypothetical protein